MLAILLAAAGVVTGSVGAYLIARRTTSGKINTSEAKDLWDEATKMRLELRHQVESLQAEIARFEQRELAWRDRVNDLESQLVILRRRVAELESHGRA